MSRWTFTTVERSGPRNISSRPNHEAIIQRIYNNPPREVTVNGERMFIIDPTGEGDFAINFTAGSVATLEDATIQEVLAEARASDRELMVEVFVRAVDEQARLNPGPVSVIFTGPNAPAELNSLQWRLDTLDSEDEWELVATYRI